MFATTIPKTNSEISEVAIPIAVPTRTLHTQAHPSRRHSFAYYVVLWHCSVISDVAIIISGCSDTTTTSTSKDAIEGISLRPIRDALTSRSDAHKCVSECADAAGKCVCCYRQSPRWACVFMCVVYVGLCVYAVPSDTHTIMCESYSMANRTPRLFR